MAMAPPAPAVELPAVMPLGHPSQDLAIIRFQKTAVYDLGLDPAGRQYLGGRRRGTHHRSGRKERQVGAPPKYLPRPVFYVRNFAHVGDGLGHSVSRPAHRERAGLVLDAEPHERHHLRSHR